jgi:hypothetical protein
LATGDQIDRQQEATIDLACIRGDGVDLGRPVGRSDGTPVRVAVTAEVDEDDVSLDSRPLALHPDETIAERECQVVSGMLGHRCEDLDPELRRLLRDRQLRDSALAVRLMCVHERMFP